MVADLCMGWLARMHSYALPWDCSAWGTCPCKVQGDVENMADLAAVTKTYQAALYGWKPKQTPPQADRAAAALPHACRPCAASAMPSMQVRRPQNRKLPVSPLFGHAVTEEHHVRLQVPPAGTTGGHMEAVASIPQLHIPVRPAHRPLDIPVRASHRCSSLIRKETGNGLGDTDLEVGSEGCGQRLVA